MSSGSERFVHLDKFSVVDPEQVDGLSFRRGTVTLHLRSGRAIYVQKDRTDDQAEWAIAEVLAELFPAPPETPRPLPPRVIH